jgi:HKD family nuclease
MVKSDGKGQPTLWPTLLGVGNAYITGLPVGFQLAGALLHAKEIRLATAFAQPSGWDHVKSEIVAGTAAVKLLTGLDCFQTHPKLLQEWRELSVREDRINAKLAADDLFFHPKVLIVASDGQPDFAIVGSGNLSDGGLQKNVECGLYVNDPDVVTKLIEWFEAQFDRASVLTDDSIAEYAPSYWKNHKRRKALEADHAAVSRKMATVGQAIIAKWKAAVQAAKNYFAGSGSKAHISGRRAGAQQLLQALKYPAFDFDRSGFDKFYSIKALGRLDPRYKGRIWKRAVRLRAALRALIADAESALPQVLERKGKLHVAGAGLNTISKILAAHDPKAWPVFNSRVEAALNDFGYRPPRGAGITGRYLAYKRLMQKFSDACGSGIDAFALDAFFYDRSKQIEKK